MQNMNTFPNVSQANNEIYSRMKNKIAHHRWNGLISRVGYFSGRSNWRSAGGRQAFFGKPTEEVGVGCGMDCLNSMPQCRDRFGLKAHDVIAAIYIDGFAGHAAGQV